MAGVDAVSRQRMDRLDAMEPAPVGSVGLLDQYRQARLLANYWTGKAIHFRECLRQKTAGTGKTSQSGAAEPLPDPEGSREVARQATTSPQPRTSQGPLPSPKRSRGRQEELADNEPPSPRAGRQELAGPAIAAVLTGHDPRGGPHRHPPMEPGCTMGSPGMARLESRLEQQPLGVLEPHERPPAAPRSSRLELKCGGEENQIARKYSKKQAPRPGQTPIPGHFIKKYLAPSGPTGADTPRSGESGDTIVAD